LAFKHGPLYFTIARQETSVPGVEPIGSLALGDLIVFNTLVKQDASGFLRYAGPQALISSVAHRQALFA
jgi:hypothetical protein